MNPLAVATQGKGLAGMLKRAGTIGARYGVTAGKMDAILARFVQTLEGVGCGATFPVTVAAVARNPGVIEKYQARGIEFAVHGYHHVDHSRLSEEAQLQALERARTVFAERGIDCHGFRCPYLRWGPATLAAVRASGFLYDSSQALAWDVTGAEAGGAYRRVLGFYGAVNAAEYPALPRIDAGLVRIPYCLPDDEALMHRLGSQDAETMARQWLAILDATRERGELFTLGLHPERIGDCSAALVAVLRRAGQEAPGVWIARLDEIARWWRARMEAVVTVTAVGPGAWRVRVDGPPGTTLLVRHAEADPAPAPWYGSDGRVPGDTVTVWSARRPFIGVSAGSAPELRRFLAEQGYIVETAESPDSHAVYMDRPEFDEGDHRPLLAQLEPGAFSLVRLGRWPRGARSALCVTGDIDALTIWDYGLRFLGG